MPRIDWKAALKAMAGFAAGLALWIFATPLYNRVLAASAETTLRAFENPKVTRLRPDPDNKHVTIDRTDFDPRSKRPAIPLDDLTFNVVLLTALFALAPRTFTDRNIGGFIAAMVLLGLTHVGATIAEVMSFYAGRFGMWSTVHYSDFERNFWGVANHFYRVVGMYAIVFVLWWGLRDTGRSAPKVAQKSKARKKK